MKPATAAHLTTSGGAPQEVRMHLARAWDGAVCDRHAVLQYRDIGDREWSAALQTVCGLRAFWLGGRAYGEWCDVCYGAWRANG